MDSSKVGQEYTNGVRCILVEPHCWKTSNILPGKELPKGKNDYILVTLLKSYYYFWPP